MPALAPTAPPCLIVPRGWGFRVLPPNERRGLDSLRDLFDHLLVWEPPRRGKRYVLSVDVSDGVGQDRSVGDITRVADFTDGDEQVAQFVTDSVDPIDLASYLDVIGRYYRGADNLSALCAIEVNGHGLTTQAELQKRLGYDNFFIFQRENMVDVEKRFSNAIGWQTTRFTRPLIMTRYIKRLKSFDLNSGMPDYRVNSPFTIQELRTLRRPPGGSLGDSEADPNDPNAKDDAIMAGAIGVHVAQTLHYEEGESMDQVRCRLTEERRRRELHQTATGQTLDYFNTDLSAEEMQCLQGRAGVLGPRGRTISDGLM